MAQHVPHQQDRQPPAHPVDRAPLETVAVRGSDVPVTRACCSDVPLGEARSRYGGVDLHAVLGVRWHRDVDEVLVGTRAGAVRLPHDTQEDVR